MLDDYAATDRLYLVMDVIKEFSSNDRILRGGFLVSAQVGGIWVVVDERIDCMFKTQHSSVDIDIFWKDAGIDYKKLGLFPAANTRFQEMKRVAGKLCIFDPQYKLEITLSDIHIK